MIVLSNDDGKKMAERDAVEQFLDEYARVTGIELELIGAGERPDFIAKRRGRRCGIELVRAMRNPIRRDWDVIFGGDGHFHGLDATILVQELTYGKDAKRKSPGWRYPNSTILVIQLVGSNGAELGLYLDDALMDEMAATGFKEIWISDDSPFDAFGTNQLFGVKPKRWRGLHRHALFGTKPYG